MIWEINKMTSVDKIHLQTKQYGYRCVAPLWVLYLPIELIVVIMCLPPEVEPDEQQAEGKKEDKGPQQLPLHTHKNIVSPFMWLHYILLELTKKYNWSLFDDTKTCLRLHVTHNAEQLWMLTRQRKYPVEILYSCYKNPPTDGQYNSSTFPEDLQVNFPQSYLL